MSRGIARLPQLVTALPRFTRQPSERLDLPWPFLAAERAFVGWRIAVPINPGLEIRRVDQLEEVKTVVVGAHLRRLMIET